jgi:S1 RNA binding domain protein
MGFMVEEKKVESSSVQIGDVVDCVVEQIMPYGVFVRVFTTKQRGMVHISELSANFVKKVEDVVSIGQEIRASVIKIDEKGRIDLSIKKLEEKAPVPQQSVVTKEDKDSFEKRLSNFLKNSESKIADLNIKLNNPKGSKRRSRGVR